MTVDFVHPRQCGRASRIYVYVSSVWPRVTLGGSFFLSSLDPGVGKTQTVFHFLSALLASQKHEDVAAVVFMFTKEELKTFVDEALEAGLPKEACAARVHKEDTEINELGRGNPEKARILFTTQQR